MSTLARQLLAASRKRKEIEGSNGGVKPPPPPIKPRAEPPKPGPKPAPKQAPKPSLLGQSRPEPSALPAKNRLLAGYLAHEFLTKGTLFGEPFDPARAEASAKPAEPDQAKPKAYADVALLMKLDGTHIPGVVNPTQLGHWIQKGKI